MKRGGAAAWAGKTSQVYTRKSGMDAGLAAFSQLAKFLVTKLNYRRAAIILITRSQKRTFGAMTRARRITIATLSSIQKIRPTITLTKKCVREILPTIGWSRSGTIPIRQSQARVARFFSTFAAASTVRRRVARRWQNRSL